MVVVVLTPAGFLTHVIEGAKNVRILDLVAYAAVEVSCAGLSA
jgi:hypothetical protein